MAELFDVATATLIERNYDPVKSGTVKVSWNAMGSEEEARMKAEGIMKSFCSPQGFKITKVSDNVEVNSVTSNAVATSNSSASVTSTNNTKNRPLIQFRCE